ncbi:MAG TPA: hypothetical protein P5548_00425 [Candidatus Moranbacteria bacterium]|nr:hypothetical protein [Candidatus Moranbacteria bacterium]HRZ33357.1 hypothetical protein [Candidatus Moranbacteria bacterium]
MKKQKVAIVSLSSCKGCQFALLNLGKKFIDIMKNVEIVDFDLFKINSNSELILDIGFVEGNPITEEDKKTLISLREKSKKLVVLGNCGAMGGIPEIKNYREQKQSAKHFYRYIHGIKDEPIKEIDNFVKVDFTFPGCPISGEEFLEYFPIILESAISSKDFPKIPDKSVCIQCRAKGNRCLLLDKKPCFGSMILGGCDAVCPSYNMPCQGCRGLRPSTNIKEVRESLRNIINDEEFENISEIYGLRDDIEAKEKK